MNNVMNFFGNKKKRRRRNERKQINNNKEEEFKTQSNNVSNENRIKYVLFVPISMIFFSEWAND